MVRSSEYRRRKYAGKIDPDVIASRFELLDEHIKQGFIGKVGVLVEIENNIKMLCEKYVIASIYLPAYYNVGRELFKVFTNHIGDTALAEAKLVCNKWATRGLNTSLIAEIAKKFGWTISPVSWY